MPDRVQPGAIGSDIIGFELATALSWMTEGWVFPADEPSIAARLSPQIDHSELNAFDASWSSNSLTVTIEPGEAIVGGWLATNVQHDVDLDADTTDQTIYVGHNAAAAYDEEQHPTPNLADEIIIGLADAFNERSFKTPLWIFDTDGNGVVDAENARQIGPAMQLQDISVVGEVGIENYRRAVSRMIPDLAENRFAAGMGRMDFDEGLFEVYTEDDEIVHSENVTIDYGVPGTVELDDDETTGFVDHSEQDMGSFVPDEAVFVDRTIHDEYDNIADLYYTIEDENGNIVEIHRDELGSIVDIGEIETFGVSVTAVFDRDGDIDADTPVLDSWSVFLSGDRPGKYYETEITNLESEV